MLLVFALINRPDIFDLRPGNSFVEFLLDEGFDVFLLDWGVPDDEDSETGLDYYVCDALPWGDARGDALLGRRRRVAARLVHRRHAVRDARRHRGRDGPARNLVLLTTPVDTSDSLYTSWVGRESFDVDFVADSWPTVPGPGGRLRQQADEAGDQLLDHQPPARPGRLRRHGQPRGAPGDGQVGGRQPAVPGARLSRVDHLDVQAERACRAAACGCAASASSSAGSSRTCSS